MQPLKERGEPRFPLEADALALLRSVERYESPVGQKQRVTSRLLMQRPARASALSFAKPLPIFALLLCAAMASAAARHAWVARENAALSARSKNTAARMTPASAVQHPLEARAQELHDSAAAVSRLAVQSSEAPATSFVGTQSPESSPATPMRSRADARGPRERAPARRSQSNDEASHLVFQGMQALRQEGRPERAEQLLGEYLRRQPRGELAEEALALSMEAAVERGDSRAKELAERYLSRYPGGRFTGAAQRTRALFTP